MARRRSGTSAAKSAHGKAAGRFSRAQRRAAERTTQREARRTERSRTGRVVTVGDALDTREGYQDGILRVGGTTPSARRNELRRLATRAGFSPAALVTLAPAIDLLAAVPEVAIERSARPRAYAVQLEGEEAIYLPDYDGPTRDGFACTCGATDAGTTCAHALAAGLVGRISEAGVAEESAIPHLHAARGVAPVWFPFHRGLGDLARQAAAIDRARATTPEDRVDLLAAVTLLDGLAGSRMLMAATSDGAIRHWWPDRALTTLHPQDGAYDQVTCTCPGGRGRHCVHDWALRLFATILDHHLGPIEAVD